MATSVVDQQARVKRLKESLRKEEKNLRAVKRKREETVKDILGKFLFAHMVKKPQEKFPALCEASLLEYLNSELISDRERATLSGWVEDKKARLCCSNKPEDTVRAVDVKEEDVFGDASVNEERNDFSKTTSGVTNVNEHESLQDDSEIETVKTHDLAQTQAESQNISSSF